MFELSTHFFYLLIYSHFLLFYFYNAFSVGEFKWCGKININRNICEKCFEWCLEFQSLFMLTIFFTKAPLILSWSVPSSRSDDWKSRLLKISDNFSISVKISTVPNYISTRTFNTNVYLINSCKWVWANSESILPLFLCCDGQRIRMRVLWICKRFSSSNRRRSFPRRFQRPKIRFWKYKTLFIHQYLYLKCVLCLYRSHIFDNDLPYRLSKLFRNVKILKNTCNSNVWNVIIGNSNIQKFNGKAKSWLKKFRDFQKKNSSFFEIKKKWLLSRVNTCSTYCWKTKSLSSKFFIEVIYGNGLR